MSMLQIQIAGCRRDTTSPSSRARERQRGKAVGIIARLVTAILSIAVLGAAGCDTPVTSMTTTQRVTVDVVHPLRGEIAKNMDLPGDVVGFYEAALHSKVTGY